jgi:hypothetical protein
MKRPENKNTQIQVKKTTVERLFSYRKLGDSWDIVVNRALDALEGKR